MGLGVVGRRMTAKSCSLAGMFSGGGGRVGNDGKVINLTAKSEGSSYAKSKQFRKENF